MSHKRKIVSVVGPHISGKIQVPDVQAGFRKAEESEIKSPTSMDHSESKRIPEKHLLLLH